jgi:ABC-type sugar transport system permease subunit
MNALGSKSTQGVNSMRSLSLLLIPVALLLSACAVTPPMVRSDVTSFHQWPQTVADKTFSFAGAASKDPKSLETQEYERLVADQLARLGYTRKDAGGALSVSFTPDIQSREVKVSEPVDTWGYRSPFWPYRSAWDYPPYFWGPFMERTYTMQVYTRTLKLAIEQGGKRVFEATAVSEGTTKTLPVIMPYLVASVFDGFPGESGKTRRVELPMQK